MKPHEARSVADLAACVNAGSRPKFIFFWGRTPAKDGSVTKACFSQWYSSPFWIDGLLYPTAEHFMMASKARLFDDQESLGRIRSAPSPGAAKAFGRAVQGFDERVWAEHRYEIVIKGNYEKFRQNPQLLTFMLSTKERVLVEASPIDRIWGIGMAETETNAGNPLKWRGLNLLGFALMEARGRLSATLPTELER